MKINSTTTTDFNSNFKSQILEPALHEWVGQALNSENPQATLTEKITTHLSATQSLDPFKKAEVEQFSNQILLASYTVFDRSEGTLQVFPGNEETAGPPQTFEAHNNATKDSNGPWPNGDYNYTELVPHPDSDQNGKYGTHGNFVFDVPGRSGMGIHSGREDKGGPTHPTLGCIRTTDEGTQYLKQLNEEDSIQFLRVQD